jgi:hypothetical protein
MRSFAHSHQIRDKLKGLYRRRWARGQEFKNYRSECQELNGSREEHLELEAALRNLQISTPKKTTTSMGNPITWMRTFAHPHQRSKAKDDMSLSTLFGSSTSASVDAPTDGYDQEKNDHESDSSREEDFEKKNGEKVELPAPLVGLPIPTTSPRKSRRDIRVASVDGRIIPLRIIPLRKCRIVGAIKKWTLDVGTKNDDESEKSRDSEEDSEKKNGEKGNDDPEKEQPRYPGRERRRPDFYQAEIPHRRRYPRRRR